MTNSKLKLLIVEDDLSSQQYYTVILKNLYELTLVGTVEAAKQALRKTDFSLVLVDISLPGEQDGLDLIRFLVSEHPKQLTSIAISAHAFPTNRQEALDAGATEYFTKPIMSGELLDVIQKYLQKQ